MRRSKVVFCEDDPMIQKVIRAALRTTDHEVHVASDGAEGLALIKRVRPDVVFTDVAMPGLDGYALAKALKADPETRDIPIVFMTASVQRAQLDRAAAYGVTSVLAKPFTMADLRARVDELVARGR
ncbi:MAG TPA: response regulator [Candidatus Limnocylindria bacterium]|nr:response regulator [Candidatus Limnocylindria bacterium]